MKSLPSSFPRLAEKHVAKDSFVEYWASNYPKPVNESKYQDNIGKPLTAERVRALFEWKNNGSISKLKRDSIQRNYIDDKPKAPRAGDRDGLVRFVCQPNGAIWLIFWLHCYDPLQHPIFDQHVYRAMRHLLDGKASEPPATNCGKARAYADEYVSFFKEFDYPKGKLLDQALWLYGKFLMNPNAA